MSMTEPNSSRDPESRDPNSREPSSRDPNSAPQRLVSDKQLALIVYVLYLIAYFNGVSAVIGVIIAHMRISEADDVALSHYQFQIRTFWIGLLYIAIGVVLLSIFIGIIVLIWVFVWTLVRNVKGVLTLNDNRPIANPASWMFG